jgi:hypothetical protein
MRHGRGGIVRAVLMGYAGLLLACAPVRYYDPYYHDYHYWNHDEIVLYGQWEGETHRQHADFNRRSGDEQKEYFNWRHQHGGH